MKRIIPTILVITLMMSISSINVFAKQFNKKGNGNFIPPGIAKKIFDDSDEVKWAQKAIEKLWSKGFIRGWQGKFLPRSSVTKVEALVMTLRIMDWEEEALQTQSLPKEYKGDEVHNWAKGYVKVAYEKSSLDDSDIKDFKPHEPVKRYEVAKYIIRALGKEEEAEDCMDKKLPFVDAASVPEDSVGYVYLINKLGIMTGDKKVFNPMGSLTRAEMAVLFNNLDSKVDTDRNIEVKEVIIGEIKAIDLVGSCHIIINNTNYNLSKSAKVKFNTSTKELDDLDVGMIVEAVLVDNIVTEISTQIQLIKVEGIIKEADNKSIEVYANSSAKEYSFSNDMEIDLEDYTDELSSLKEGMKVELILLNNLVKRLYAMDNKFKVEGEIEDIITSNDGYKFKLKVDGKYYIYYVSEDIDLENIEEGMEGEFEIKNITIIDIDLED